MIPLPRRCRNHNTPARRDEGLDGAALFESWLTIVSVFSQSPHDIRALERSARASRGSGLVRLLFGQG